MNDKSKSKSELVQSHLEIARAYLKIYQFEKTILEAAKILTLDHTSQEAFQLIRKSVKREDSLKALMTQVGQYEKKGDFEKAYKKWKQILDLFPMHEEVHERMEKAREKIREKELERAEELSRESDIDESSQNDCEDEYEDEFTEDPQDMDTRDLEDLLSETRRWEIAQAKKKTIPSETKLSSPDLEPAEEPPREIPSTQDLEPVEEPDHEIPSTQDIEPAEVEKESDSSRSKTEALLLSRRMEEANQLLKQGDFKGVEKISQMVLKIQPAHRGAQEMLKSLKEQEFVLASIIGRAKKWEKQGEWPRALAEWKKVLDLFPDNQRVLKKVKKLKDLQEKHLKERVEKVENLWQEKKFRRLLLECQKALKTDSNSEYWQSFLKQAKDEIKRAENLLNQAIEYGDQGNWQKTLDFAQKALEVDPQKGEATQLAEQAKEYLKRTEKFSPNLFQKLRQITEEQSMEEELSSMLDQELTHLEKSSSSVVEPETDSEPALAPVPVPAPTPDFELENNSATVLEPSDDGEEDRSPKTSEKPPTRYADTVIDWKEEKRTISPEEEKDPLHKWRISESPKKDDDSVIDWD